MTVEKGRLLGIGVRAPREKQEAMVHALANRTWERAVELAERVGGDAVRLADLDTTLADVDLLLTSTGARTGTFATPILTLPLALPIT